MDVSCLVPLTRSQRRDVRLLAGMLGVSLLGDEVALITLYLRVAHAGHGWMIAALSIAGVLPIVVLSPVAGYVTDRFAAKPLLSALGVVEALVCVAIGLVHGDLATIALLALLTCAVAFSLPGYQALVPAASGEEHVSLAQSTIQSWRGVAMTAGPALGGLLVAAVGQSDPLFVDAASFVVMALATWALRADRRPALRPGAPLSGAAGIARHGPGGPDAPLDQGAAQDQDAPEGRAPSVPRAKRRELSAGLRLVAADPLLRAVTVTVGVFMLSLGAINVAEVFFITRTLHAGALAYGLLGATFGAGSVLGALAARRLGQSPWALTRHVLLDIAAISVLLFAVGLCTKVGYVYPLMIATGAAVGSVNVATTTLFAVRTPDRLRGRVFAASGAVYNGAQLGSMMAGGLLLAALSPRTIFQLAGGISIVAVGAVGTVQLRRNRHHAPSFEARAAADFDLDLGEAQGE